MSRPRAALLGRVAARGPWGLQGSCRRATHRRSRPRPLPRARKRLACTAANLQVRCKPAGSQLTSLSSTASSSTRGGMFDAAAGGADTSSSKSWAQASGSWRGAWLVLFRIAGIAVCGLIGCNLLTCKGCAELAAQAKHGGAQAGVAALLLMHAWPEQRHSLIGRHSRGAGSLPPHPHLDLPASASTGPPPSGPAFHTTPHTAVEQQGAHGSRPCPPRPPCSSQRAPQAPRPPPRAGHWRPWRRSSPLPPPATAGGGAASRCRHSVPRAWATRAARPQRSARAAPAPLACLPAALCSSGGRRWCPSACRHRRRRACRPQRSSSR